MRRSSRRGHGRHTAYPTLRIQGVAASRLNKVCEIDDWADADRVRWMRALLPYIVAQDPRYPTGLEHRKHWEFAQLMRGLEVLDALRDDAVVLSTGAGHEDPVYALTNHVRWVFATDTYGSGGFRLGEGDARMLTDPDAFARFPYRRGRLVVEWMDALDLRFDDATFDVTFSLSSVEHFGGATAAACALAEMARVTRPGGIVAVTTECVVNDAPPYDGRGLALFTPAQLDGICAAVGGLELVEPVDYGISPATLANVTLVADAIAGARRGHISHPAIVMEHKGRQYTSVSLFLRRTAR